MNAPSTNASTARDPHLQLRRLYDSLLEEQSRFDEFKQLLALYPTTDTEGGEGHEAQEVREKLNSRIRTWLSGDFDGLSVAQVRLWRGIVVEERINMALAPWRGSNIY
jgi:hypothetical protein